MLDLTKLNTFNSIHNLLEEGKKANIYLKEKSKSANLWKEHNHKDVVLKQVPQWPMSPHGACTSQLREYKELVFPKLTRRNIQDHT